MSKLKVENTTYIKDTQTGTVINTNNSEYLNARSRRSKQKRDKNIIVNLREELNELKTEMKQMVRLVRELRNGD